MNLQRLTMLLHHRWAVPILAELHRSSGAKFVTLVNRLGASRDSLTTTLKALIEHEWVMRNPGYGHPMRPEYVLTRKGKTFGPWCVRTMRVLTALGLEDVGLRKWSIPVAMAIRARQRRFSELRSTLPSLTARALALALKELQSAGIVERQVTDAYPPRTTYSLTAVGMKITGAVSA